MAVETSTDEARQVELQRRIEALATMSDADFGGPLSTLELAAATFLFVGVPGLVAWLFR